MKRTIIISVAAAFLSIGLMAQNKAVVQTNFRSKEDASITISELLEQEGFEVGTSTNSKITAVFSPEKRDRKGKSQQDHKPDFQSGQRPQGGNGQGGFGGGQGGPGGFGGPGGQGGPGMGPGGQGGPGMGGPGEQGSNDSEEPTVTVKLKGGNQGVQAIFRLKNMPTMKGGKSGASSDNADFDAGQSENRQDNPQMGQGFQRMGPRKGMLQRIIERIPNSGVQYK